MMAVGVAPATEFLKASGFSTLKDGSLEVDEYLKVKGAEDVYAIGELEISGKSGTSCSDDLFPRPGDIATFPEHTTGQNVRIEHWNVRA